MTDGSLYLYRRSFSDALATVIAQAEQRLQRWSPFQAAKCPFAEPVPGDMLPPRRSIKRTSLHSHMEPQFHRGSRSIKRASLDFAYGNDVGGGCGEGWEYDEAMIRLEGLGGLRGCGDSPEKQGFGGQGFERLTTGGRRHSLSSYESRGSNASSPTDCTLPLPMPR